MSPALPVPALSPSSSSSRGDALLDDPLYPRLKEHLVEATGLTYYADKDVDLARRLRRRLTKTGSADCATYFGLLRDPIRGPAELDALIAEIAIGETYFFRHREHFEALAGHVLPDLIARNRLTRSMRIWCAGCADGPEPYSLAILLKREMADQLTGWNVSILGTDINRQGLVRARAGRFAEWALRATPNYLRQECFSQEENLWCLRPEYKNAVSFEYHNLVEHPFPSLVNNLSAFDLIICRNVMIYFDSQLMQRMVRQFYQCLVPGGWLLVGPSEPNMTFFTAFHSVNLPGLTLYQRPVEQEQQGQQQRAQADWKPQEQQKSTAIQPHAVAEMFPPLLSVPPPRTGTRRKADPAPAKKLVLAGAGEKQSVDAALAQVRSQADRGAWQEAERCCDDLLASEPLNARVHFYRGLVLEQTQKYQQAEQSLRRAIYLDRQSVLAHYYLGLILQARGDPHQATLCFENTLRLVAGIPQASPFADGDGITAGELGQLAARHLEILKERGCDTSF